MKYIKKGKLSLKIEFSWTKPGILIDSNFWNCLEPIVTKSIAVKYSAILGNRYLWNDGRTQNICLFEEPLYLFNHSLLSSLMVSSGLFTL